jgi:Prokaryotic N-terminal methylation motif
MFKDYDPAPFAHGNGGRATSRAVATSLARGCSILPRRGSALGFAKYRSRGRDPSQRFNRQSAFSLVEVLASLFILTLSAVGITAAWRLADYQELLTRADRRAERILREYYELQTFAPADSRPFSVNASVSPSPSPITGYLYYPKLIADQSGSPQFGKMIPFSISMAKGTAEAQLMLTYTIPCYGTQPSRQVTKTVVLNP